MSSFVALVSGVFSFPRDSSTFNTVSVDPFRDFLSQPFFGKLVLIHRKQGPSTGAPTKRRNPRGASLYHAPLCSIMDMQVWNETRQSTPLASAAKRVNVWPFGRQNWTSLCFTKFTPPCFSSPANFSWFEQEIVISSQARKPHVDKTKLVNAEVWDLTWTD